ASATSHPSLPIERTRNAPPGATITAAPVACAGSGRKGVSVARDTLRTNGSPHCSYQLSSAGWPGTPPVLSGIALGSAGAGIGVFGASSCACTENDAHSMVVSKVRATRDRLMHLDMTKPP